MKRKIIFICILTVAIAVFFVGLSFKPGQNSLKNSEPQNTQINLQQYNLANLYQELKQKCKEFTCFENELQSFIPSYGPTASLELLQELQKDSSIAPSIDDHQIAHRIGRKTADIFGVSGEAFLLCPTSYNYGCQHGFFEHALGRASSPEEAATLICGSIEKDPSFSSKFKFYCYHGVGHGILMAYAYDLTSSLNTCDSLPTGTGQAGCWQGVFMENVNGGMKGEARSNTFSQTDPLEPCNKLNEKYRHECFINHAGWLMNFFKYDVAAASRACLKAAPENIGACLESIGLMTTNPSWQSALLSKPKTENRKLIPKEICDQFPLSHREYCIIGAVDNLMNFNELSISEGAEFCDTIDADFKTMCYRRIGANLRSQATDNNIILEQCSTLKEDFKITCMSGAGIN